MRERVLSCFKCLKKNKKSIPINNELQKTNSKVTKFFKKGISPQVSLLWLLVKGCLILPGCDWNISELGIVIHLLIQQIHSFNKNVWMFLRWYSLRHWKQKLLPPLVKEVQDMADMIIQESKKTRSRDTGCSFRSKAEESLFREESFEHSPEWS